MSRWPGSLPIPLTLLLLLTSCSVLQYPRRWDGEFLLPTVARARRPAAAPEGNPRSPVGASQPAEDRLLAPAISVRLSEDVESMLEFASGFLGKREVLEVDGRRFPADCSGFVAAIYYSAGIDLMAGANGNSVSGTSSIYQFVDENGRVFESNPRPGDLVFFDNTWDRDADGELNDEFTHIAIVESQLGDGILELIHMGGTGVGRIRMTLERSNEYRDDESGDILNHKLRRHLKLDPDGTPYLTGELFRSFGRPKGLSSK